MKEIRLPLGAVAVRMRVYAPAGDEIARALTPPWPRWMRRFYELEEHGIDGPLIHVCELDQRGLPRLIERWERR